MVGQWKDRDGGWEINEFLQPEKCNLEHEMSHRRWLLSPDLLTWRFVAVMNILIVGALLPGIQLQLNIR